MSLSIPLHLASIDIFLTVIDNYGDVGFCAELCIAIESRSPGCYHFVIWTDHVDFVEEFFARNMSKLGSVSIRSISDFGRDRLSRIAFSLFHAPIPPAHFFTDPSLVLRIDYLSLDASWNIHHLTPHIDSDMRRQILEMIPSPLASGSGMIHCQIGAYSRADIAEMFDIDPSRHWIPIFAYKDTLDEHIIWDQCEYDMLLLFFGGAPQTCPLPYHVIPFVSLEVFHHIIAYAHWAIVRGEVSLITTVSLGRPFFWDMYRSIGGFHAGQSEAFLSSGGFDPDYAEIHLRMNGQKNPPVRFGEMVDCMRSFHDFPAFVGSDTKDLIGEIQKQVDRSQNSI